MRILVAAERLGRAGGMERYLDVVLPALAARGATIRVLARRIDAVPPGIEAERVEWADEHEAPSAGAERAVLDVVERTFRPDVAVAHNVMDARVLAALRGARRLVYHVHDHRPFCPNGDRVFPRTGRNCTEPLGGPCRVHALLDGCAYGPRRRTALLIARRQRLRDNISASDAVIVASRYVAERAHDSGVAEERIVEIPLPLPDDAYAERDVAATARDGAPAERDGARTVVFAGRVVPQKGLDSLVRAVALITPERRPRVRVVGDGPALAEARREAARLGVMLDAFGTVAPAAVRAALDEAALVALPSRWAEPFGYVGIEAFARQRTVVAYDVGGVRAWLANGTNGIAVPPGDERTLAGALEALLCDEARRMRLARRARDDAEQYRLGVVLPRLLTTYSPP